MCSIASAPRTGRLRAGAGRAAVVGVEPVFIAAFLAIVLVAIVVGINLDAKHRREGLQQLAQRTGMMFSPGRDDQMAARFGFLRKLARGENRYAFNVLWGNFQNRAVYAFDYHYETYSRNSEGRETRDHYLSCFVLMLERPFPELIIAREGFLSQLAQTFGYEDIDFESHEFSRTFCVRSRDKRFAYDFCHPRTMEYLLQNQDLEIEVEGHALALVFSGRLNPMRAEHNLRRLVQLRGLIPNYMLSDVPAPATR